LSKYTVDHERFARIWPVLLTVSLFFFGCGPSKQLVKPEVAPAKTSEAPTPDSTLTSPESPQTLVVSAVPDTSNATQIETNQVLASEPQVADTITGRVSPPPLSFSPTSMLSREETDSMLTLGEGIGVATTLDSSRIDLLVNTRSDSTLTDTTRQSSDLDTTIFYSGDELLFDVINRASIIRGHAKIIYKDMTLTAYEILIDWKHELMTSTPLLDTLYTDSTESEIDTIKIVGKPTFDQGKQRMDGMLMRVNLKTKAGYVEGGSTDFSEGFYRGDRIQKVTDDVFFIQDGAFTTCDADPPHYKFTGSKMKMIRGDKVVGKPVVLRFGDVPVAALPFAMFSIKGGRHSGILIPTYGDDSSQGRYIRDLGYYWAASDYWDIKGMMDYFEESGFRVRSNLVYNKRYLYTGGISASYKDERNDQIYWNLAVKHNQKINERTTLRVNGDFVSSSDFYKTQTLSANQQLKQTISSDATLTTSWPTLGLTGSFNLSQDQNLRTGEYSQTFPSFSISSGSRQLFPTAEKKLSSDKTLIYQPPQERIEPGAERPEDPDKWYNTITYTYRTSGSYKRDVDLVDADSLNGNYDEESEGAMGHTVAFSAPQKVMKYITLNPTLNFKSDWMLRRYNYSLSDYGDLITTEERGFFTRQTFNASLNSSTKFYGMFNIEKGSIKAVRHVVTPSVSLNWKPDFSDKEWGYYQHLEETYYDTSDAEWVKYDEELDRYKSRIVGGSPTGRQFATNFSIGNLFQMKTSNVDAEGVEKENKFDLFTVNVSSAYNFAADSLRISDLSTSLRASPISSKSAVGPLKSLNLSFSSTHSFYQYDSESKKTVDKLYMNRTGGSAYDPLRLKRISGSASFTLEFGNPLIKRESRIVYEGAPEDTLDFEEQQLENIRNEFDNQFSEYETDLPTSQSGGSGGRGGAPLKLSNSLTYQNIRTDPENIKETLSLSSSISLKLTRSWAFSYRTQVNLMTREVTTGTLSVSRDLHCWSGSFSWTPTGGWQGFYLRIGIKAPMLSDVKLDQRRGSSSPTF